MAGPRAQMTQLLEEVNILLAALGAVEFHAR
jgi:hypothetical protein